MKHKEHKEVLPGCPDFSLCILCYAVQIAVYPISDLDNLLSLPIPMYRAFLKLIIRVCLHVSLSLSE